MTHKLKLKTTRQPSRSSRLTKEDLHHLKEDIQSTLTNIKTKSTKQSVEQVWGALKQTVKEATDKICKNKHKNRQHKYWITSETITLIEERKKMKAKGVHTEREQTLYKRLCKQIQRKCRQDKNNYIQKTCEEIERHHNRGETRDLYKKIKFLTRKFTPRTLTIEDKSGKILWERNEILERWRDYCAELYNEESPETQKAAPPNTPENEREPDIVRAEVEHAIKYLKTNKSPGQDEINEEALQALGDDGVDIRGV